LETFFFLAAQLDGHWWKGSIAMKKTLLYAILSLNIIFSIAAYPSSLLVQDSFDTDPFVVSSPRWTQQYTSTYGMYWADTGWNPNSIGGGGYLPLPGAAAPCMYAFGDGYRRMWTTDTTSCSQSYSVSTDIMITGGTSMANISFGHYVQRQGASISQAYEASFQIGANGLTTPKGIYNASAATGTALQIGTWYTFTTDVRIDANFVSIKSMIFNKSTGVVMNATATYIDSSVARRQDAKGFGYFVYKTTANYWTQAILTDNFIVVSKPQRWCGDTATVFAAGDISGKDGIPDCTVDFYDLAAFASQWLMCSDPADSLNCVQSYWPWLNNSLGKEDIVPVPWTPMTVSSADSRVSAWGRDHIFSAIGLPQNIYTQAADQTIDDLLIEPMRLNAIANGTDVTFVPNNPILIAGTDTKCVVTAQSSSSSGNLQLSIVTTIEYDGFAQVDLTLTGSGATTLNRFWLEVPIKQNNALFHMPLFINDPTITSEVIKRPLVGDYDWTNAITTDLYWVGGDDRGLVLTAEDDRTWSSANRNEAQELVPSADRVTWRYHFVDDAVARNMATPLKITYFFMATPVKPVANWYGVRSSSDAGYGMDVTKAANVWVKYAHIHEPWTEIMGYPGTFTHESDIRQLISQLNDYGIALCLYSHPVISSAAPEFKEWLQYWASSNTPYRAAFYRDQSFDMVPQSVYFVNQTSSWADFYVYNWVKMIKNWHAKGAYLDGTFGPGLSSNPNFDHAYIVGNESRPTRTIVASRDFMKRWYKAAKDIDPNFFFLGHLSVGAYFMPTAAYLDFCMGGEQLSYLGPTGELPWGLMRADQTGRQYGLIREFFTTVNVTEPYVMALALVHGSNVWGRGCGDYVAAWQKPVWNTWDSFGVKDADWVPYWKNSVLVTSSNPDVKVSYYVKTKQVLLVAATNKRVQPTATIMVNLPGLGLNPASFTATLGGAAVTLTPDGSGKLNLTFPSQLTVTGGYMNYLWLRSP
jgi:hypothetical protein